MSRVFTKHLLYLINVPQGETRSLVSRSLPFLLLLSFRCFLDFSVLCRNKNHKGEKSTNLKLFGQFNSKKQVSSWVFNYSKFEEATSRSLNKVFKSGTSEDQATFIIGILYTNYQEPSKDMSVLYSSNFTFPDGDLRKNQEFMDSSCYLQQIHQQNSGLMRYRSAPGSFLENLVNGSVTASAATGFEDYRDIQSSSPEMETFFMLGNSSCHDLQEYGEKSVKQEESQPISQQNGCSDSSEMMYQSLPVHSLANDNTVSVANSMKSSFGLSSSMGLENSMQAKQGNENGANLVRQSSSPPEFFSNLGVDDIGFKVIGKTSTFGTCNGSNNETTSTGRLYNKHISFSSRPSSCSRHMPGIAEVESESMGVSGPETSGDGQFVSNSGTHSWNNASLSGLKRARESDGDLLGNLNRSQTQGYSDHSTALTHHLSLPRTLAEMAVVEKLWQLQGSVPCKIRAKRGCATHPRSIAERVRRTRISERMRKLQGLFPNMEKQTNTADMLDMAVDYIKDLQKQVQALTDTKAKCTCSGKQKHCSNLST